MCRLQRCGDSANFIDGDFCCRTCLTSFCDIDALISSREPNPSMPGVPQARPCDPVTVGVGSTEFVERLGWPVSLWPER